MSSVEVHNLAESRGLYTASRGSDPMLRLDADMKFLIETLLSLDPRPIEQLSAPEARAQPSLNTAMTRILRQPPDEQGVGMELRMIPGAAGDIRARVYHPLDLREGVRVPVILYFHGGGFVVGDLDHYDATPRMLARRCGAVVVSSHYRQAPEFKFPSAHDDAWAAWSWVRENAEALGADPGLTALAGEGSGANLALDVALRAKAEGQQRPRHLALVTPMAGTDFSLPSYREHEQTWPLSAAGVRWSYKKMTRNKSVLADIRLNPAQRADLGGLPPTTLILAELDPLRSEGEALAAALRRSGTWIDETCYDGVPHQFFGFGALVNKAMFAQGQVARNLRKSFGKD